MGRFTGMRTFVAVVEAGSISAAAAHLGTTKSVVSHRLSELEARLHAQLVLRGPRRTSLTEAGTSYYEQCVRILAAADEADEAVSGATGLRGTLRVSASFAFAQLHLNAMLAELAARHPELRIAAEIDDSYLDMVASGVEVAIRIGALPDSSLKVRKICHNRIVIVASPAYLAARGVPRTPADLAEHDGVVRIHRQPFARWPFTVDGARQWFPIRPRLQTNAAELMIDAARAGLGLALLPTFIASDDLRRGTLRAVLPDYPVEGGHVQAVVPENRFVPARVNALIQLMLERFHPVPPWDANLSPAPPRPRTARRPRPR